MLYGPTGGGKRTLVDRFMASPAASAFQSLHIRVGREQGVWTGDVEPADPPRSQSFSEGAYHSHVVLAFDEPERAGELDDK